MPEPLAQAPQVQAVVERLCDTCAQVAERFTAEFERLKAAHSPAAYDPRLGFAKPSGEVAPAATAMKYVLNPRGHIAQKLAYFPWFEGIRSAFDIGVGPGHLFVLLQDALGISVTGIDREGFQGEFLYKALWQALGIADRITVFEVRAGADVPIPQGTEAVLAFWPVFDKGWRPDDHRHFLDMCRDHGARHVFWRFNNAHLTDEVLRYYRDIGARFPRAQDPGFCVADLAGRHA